MKNGNHCWVARPVPLSAFSPKSNPGFSQSGEGDGVYDLLLQDHWDENLGQPVQVAGWCIKEGTTYKRFCPPTYLSVHTAINPPTKAAAEGQLFAREYLQDGSHFLMQVAGNMSGILESLINEVGFIRCGERKSGGWGKLVIENIPDAYIHSPEGSMGTVEVRLNRFNQNGQGPELLFSLTLWSDAIVVDKWLRPVSTLSPDILAWQFRLNGLKSEYSGFARVRQVHGWNVVHQLPKPVDWAIERGSCFLYRAEVDRNDRSELIKRLEELEKSGIGLRRNEGFGRVVVCDPFHLQGGGQCW